MTLGATGFAVAVVLGRLLLGAGLPAVELRPAVCLLALVFAGVVVFLGLDAVWLDLGLGFVLAVVVFALVFFELLDFGGVLDFPAGVLLLVFFAVFVEVEDLSAIAFGEDYSTNMLMIYSPHIHLAGVLNRDNWFWVGSGGEAAQPYPKVTTFCLIPDLRF